MASLTADDGSSEDEVFFGPITLKEIKARFLHKDVRRSMKHANKEKDINESDNSITIIEMHSEPEIGLTDSPDMETISNKFADHSIKSIDNSYLRLSPNDSFLKIEEQVARLCTTENGNNDVNKPLEGDKDYFNVSPSMHEHIIITEANEQSDSGEKQSVLVNTIDTSCQHQHNLKSQHYLDETPTQETTNNVKHYNDNITIEENTTINLQTPDQSEIESTQKNKANNSDVIFKTPKCFRKQQVSSIKKPPSKVNPYQHVASPVSTYIHSSLTPSLSNSSLKPQFVSLIPKMKKNPIENKMNNKENIQLSSYAYRPPKGNAVVDKKKLPHNDSSKKRTPSFVGRKHTPGKAASKKPLVPQDDSVLNLSLISQAEVSLHTEFN